jgi:hypothetical protein
VGIGGLTPNPSPVGEGNKMLGEKTNMKKILILLMLITPLASWRGVGG